MALFVPRVFAAPIDKPTDKPSLEYQVKASLIFNILHYIEFPIAADQPQNAITICFDNFARYGSAVKALEGELVNSKSIHIQNFNLTEVQHFNSAAGQHCDVLVFSGEELPDSRLALQALTQANVLTIGENEDFLQAGGIIRFSIVESTVQFDINQSQAKKARLSISSKLLRLARVVVESP
jgi:hypothetical protein